jgi:hypothetical protein
MTEDIDTHSEEGQLDFAFDLQLPSYQITQLPTF